MNNALPGYGLSEQIHEGARTLIFRGQRLEDGLPVVIKRLKSEATTVAAKRSLRHEFEFLSRLDLPGVVRAVALEEEPCGPVLVMEDIGGEALDRVLKRTPLTLSQSLALASGLAQTLAGLHRQGIIHKGISPRHIIYNRDSGQFRLIGFSLAEELSSQVAAPQPPASLADPLAYISPEQTGRMNRSLDYRTDFYSLGVTMYRMLTGRPPFTADDDLGLLHCHIAQEPVAPHALDSKLPVALSRIVMKLLAKAAEDRYQSGLGLKADLDRCARGLRDQGRIPEFEPGGEDIPDRPRLPEKLYGREQEIRQLLAAFERVVTGGKPELVLVSGYAGIGKSTVVNELHKGLVPARALFAGGKFDQYQRDIPYATIAQALQALIRQLLGRSEVEIALWREEIVAAVGAHGRLITDLVPDLVALIGEQPPVQGVPPLDAQNRFNTVFRRLVTVFARPEHPLVLFLDDLQWLDAATLQLVEHLLLHPAVKHLLLLGAYRDNEVPPSHPLMLALDSMQKTGVSVHAIVLAPLGEEEVRRLVGDALHCDHERAEPLARLVHEKTGGNPFFTIQFLTALAEEGLVVFDGSTAQWQWDLDRIRRKGFTDNVADLVVAKLGRLQPATQEALRQLACLGRRASVATLALVQGIAEEEVDKTLLQAVQAGLLLRLEDSVSFPHDRVQEAAYALIPQAMRPQVHLRIGRKLLEQASPEAGDTVVFDIVNHLNQGRALVVDPAEREQLAELNVAAGRRARGAIAYATAREYFAVAASLVGEGGWESRYELLFALYLDWAEAEYLRGSFAEAERLTDLLLGRARSDLDQVAVYGLRLNLYPIAGRYDDAVAMAIKALALLGVDIPADDLSLRQAIAAEAAAVKERLAGRSIVELAGAPEATDPRIKAVIRLLNDMGGPVYIGSRPQLYPLTPIKALRYALDFGFTKETSNSFSGYAFLLVSIFADPDRGFAFSELALELSRRFDNLGTIGEVLYLHGNHVNFWLRPLATDFPILEQGFRACLDAGNLVYANYIAYSIVWQAVERGDALDELLAFSERYADFALGSRNEAIYHSIIIEQQFVKCLRGETETGTSFSSSGLDESASLAKIAGASFTCGMMYYHTMKLWTAYLAGDDTLAREHAEAGGKLLPAVLAQPMEATYCFLHGLLLTRGCREVADGERAELLRAATGYQQRLAFWAHECPENFSAKHALLAAELAVSAGDELAAERYFEQAIAAARENGFIHWQAMANEAAARFHQGRGLATMARAYLREAHACYGRWGAVIKERELRNSHPWLRGEGAGTPDSSGSRSKQMDVMAVVKAQHAISGEIRLHSLARTLLRICMENAGACIGYLVVEGNGHLRAEMVAGEEEQRFVFNAAPEDVANPKAIVNYVRRSRKMVILTDARQEAGEFAADGYLRRARTRSVLCLAIQRQEKLLGVLYLENNLVAGAFTAERRQLLEVLAAQAAISLETACVYETLQESEERLRLTLESTRIGTWDWDVAHDIWTASPVYYTMLGYEPKEGPGDREEWMERLHPDDRALFIEKMNDVLSTKKFDDYQYEARLRHADGTYRWQLVKGFGIKRDAEGRVTRMLGIRMDIHDRKQAEEEIKLLSLALDNVREGAFLIDGQGRFHYVNQEACRSLEYAKEELIGMGVPDIDPCFPPEKLEEDISEVFTEGAITFETRHRTRSGRVFPVEISTSLIEYGGGNYTLALVRDITERKQAEEERLRHLRFFEAMDRIHRAMQGESDLEERLGAVLDVVLSIFDCDRSYLEFPCDPEAAHWRVPVERARPCYPRVVNLEDNQPMNAYFAALLRLLLASDGPVQVGPDTPYPLPEAVADHWGLKSFMAVAIYPSVGPPWVFGIHQCSQVRTWTAEEERLLQEIGRRLADGMTTLLMYRDLRESDAGLRRLKDDLEHRVAERTAELRRNNEELERMNTLFVGRELKMIELKQRIKALEGKESHE